MTITAIVHDNIPLVFNLSADGHAYDCACVCARAEYDEHGVNIKKYLLLLTCLHTLASFVSALEMKPK